MDIPQESVPLILHKDYHTLIDKFITHLDIATTSRISYRKAIRQFFAWFLKNKINNPDRETILAYKKHLDEKGLKPYTRSSYLVVVRLFFAWAETLKIYPNIARGIKGAKKSVKAHNKSSLSVPHVKRLLESIDTRDLFGKRDYALINLLICTGLRLIEVVRANIGDLQPTENGEEALLWIRGKGRDGKEEFAVVTREAIEPILAYLDARKAKNIQAPLFTSLSDRNYGQQLTVDTLSRVIKKHLSNIGLSSSRYTAHSLRHTFGVLCIHSGASLHEVQLAMRHHTSTTTQVYLGDIEKQKRLKDAPERRLISYLLKEGIWAI
jgi:integrase/recombinase XerD